MHQSLILQTQHGVKSGIQINQDDSINSSSIYHKQYSFIFIGSQDREIYNTITFSQEKESFACNVTVQKLENVCIPRQNIT